MTNFSQTPIKELAGIIARQLEADGIEVVLVGGLAVEFYSKNIYLTKDIDMVNINYQAPAIIGETMAKLGFYKKGSIYKNTSTKITVEFPSAPLFVGDKLIKETTFITIGEYKIPILNRLDVVKDRLSAYFHWKDRPALAQALTVMTCHQINPVDIKSFCLKESHPVVYNFIVKTYKQLDKKRINSMEEIEQEVLKACLEQKNRE